MHGAFADTFITIIGVFVIFPFIFFVIGLLYLSWVKGIKTIAGQMPWFASCVVTALINFFLLRAIVCLMPRQIILPDSFLYLFVPSFILISVFLAKHISYEYEKLPDTEVKCSRG